MSDEPHIEFQKLIEIAQQPTDEAFDELAVLIVKVQNHCLSLTNEVALLRFREQEMQSEINALRMQNHLFARQIVRSQRHFNQQENQRGHYINIPPQTQDAEPTENWRRGDRRGCAGADRSQG